MTSDLDTLLDTLGRHARTASRAMSAASSSSKAAALHAMAAALAEHETALLAANAEDLQAARAAGLDAALLDRLAITPKRLAGMAEGLRQIAAMPDPVGELTATQTRPNGMQVARMRVPIGVIGIIYESRPNVTLDAAALCLKSGNAAILRGGSEALRSNLALARIVQQGLEAAGLPPTAVQMIDTPDRAAVMALARLTEYVDVIVPRGGKGLIAALEKDARVPLIKHLDGNCHVYIDAHADLAQAHAIALNAKTYRFGICGAMETLLVHESVASAVLPALAQALRERGVALRGCDATRALLPDAEPADDTDWATEYLGPILAIRLVPSLDEAIAHIERWGSHHTDAIVTDHLPSAQRFQREVDSSSVYVNLPTCFADGFEYGLGAEIGISTNKLHTRGPVGLEGLTTLKWVLTGNGQTRG